MKTDGRQGICIQVAGPHHRGPFFDLLIPLSWLKVPSTRRGRSKQGTPFLHFSGKELEDRLKIFLIGLLEEGWSTILSSLTKEQKGALAVFAMTLYVRTTPAGTIRQDLQSLEERILENVL